MIKTKSKLTLGIIIDTALSIPPVTGVTYRLYYLSKKIAASNVKVKIFCCNRNIKKDSDARKLINSSLIEIHILPERIFYDVNKMSKIVGNERLDILQLEDPVSVLRYYPIAKKYNLAICFEMHDNEPELLKNFGKNNKQIAKSLEISNLAFQVSDKVFCMVKNDADKLIKDIGGSFDKVSISPNPIDFSEFKLYGPNVKAQTVLFIGNMYYEPNKVAAKLIVDKIYGPLHKKFPNLKFVFVGMLPEDLRIKYKKMRGIVFTGVVADLNPYLQQATMALCPVISGSGMKVKILNYCAAGLPIITTRIGASGYRKIVSLIVEDDVSKYQYIIEKLLNSPKEVKKIGILNYKLAKKNYDVSVIARKIIRDYVLIVASRSATTKASTIMLKKLPLPMWLEEKRVPEIKKSRSYLIKNGKVLSR